MFQLDQMLLDENVLDEILLSLLDYLQDQKNAEIILEKTYFFCMQILYQAYIIF